ncbi:hypothetical protein AB0D57_17495 [Streptomyces sp. NPDC048275]
MVRAPALPVEARRRWRPVVETWLAAFGPAPEALEKLILGIAPQRIETAD